MKIEVIEVKIADIITGDCFLFGEDYFIKGNCYKEDNQQCVNLDNGDFKWMKFDTNVRKVVAKFQILA